MELINEHEIGVCKGTEMEKDVKANFEGECAEVGMYLAMARLAQRDGLPEVAEVLKTIAFEEAAHAAVFAEMNGVISSSLKENLEMMLEGETMANNEKKASAKKAKVQDIDPAHDFFDESSQRRSKTRPHVEGYT